VASSSIRHSMSEVNPSLARHRTRIAALCEPKWMFSSSKILFATSIGNSH